MEKMGGVGKEPENFLLSPALCEKKKVRVQLNDKRGDTGCYMLWDIKKTLI